MPLRCVVSFTPLRVVNAQQEVRPWKVFSCGRHSDFWLAATLHGAGRFGSVATGNRPEKLRAHFAGQFRSGISCKFYLANKNFAIRNAAGRSVTCILLSNGTATIFKPLLEKRTLLTTFVVKRWDFVLQSYGFRATAARLCFASYFRTQKSRLREHLDPCNQDKLQNSVRVFVNRWAVAPTVEKKRRTKM